MAVSYFTTLFASASSPPRQKLTTGKNVTIENRTPLPLLAIYYRGGVQQKEAVVSDGSAALQNVDDTNAIVLTSATSGAIVHQVNPPIADAAIIVQPGDYFAPFRIPGPPSPETPQGLTVPGPSPRYLVGAGNAEVRSLETHDGPDEVVLITREQYWAQLPDSYMLAPGEEREFSQTISQGTQQTSSSQATVAASLGASASAGWGPISASLSASLSASSTTTQQFSIAEESTTYVSIKLKADTNGPSRMVLRWQLMDEVTVFSESGEPVASVILGNSPALLKSYAEEL